MRSIVILAPACVAAQAILLGLVGAEEIASQTKTGVVRNVDPVAKQVVVIVAREMTFSITAATRIVQGDQARNFADIKVGAKVTIEYTREGDTRTAMKIEIRTREAVGKSTATAADPEIKPGGTFTIEFLSLPPTLAEVLDHSRVKAQMTVCLPANYSVSGSTRC